MMCRWARIQAYVPSEPGPWRPTGSHAADALTPVAICVPGPVQCGRDGIPVVVLSRDVAIPRLRRALVAPCTTTIRGLPSEVVLQPDDDPISRHSAVNLDSVESVSTEVLVERIGRAQRNTHAPDLPGP